MYLYYYEDFTIKEISDTLNLTDSNVKNKAIIIYKYENTYFTEFHDNNIYYDIESTNVTFEDFKYILEIIIE